MRASQITITTQADKEKTQVIRKGNIECTPTGIRLIYQEEHATVGLSFEKDTVTIERTGDYTMRLSLKKGETREGSLGIGGAEGRVQTYTSRLAYSLSETSFMLSLHYDLIIGEETQCMRIRLFAKFL